MGKRPIRDARDLFEERVCRTDDCWVWTGTISMNGYGMLGVGGRKGKKLYAHRVSYNLFVGEVPEGLDLDHLCRNRRCVNPDHLEPVTRGENTRRGDLPKILKQRAKDRTHCMNGHIFNDSNTRLRKSGGKICRTCEKIARYSRVQD